MEQNSEVSAMTRRNILRAAGAGALTLGGLGLVGRASAKGLQKPSDADILTFALNLEYLEAEFYRMATTGKTLDSGDTKGAGNVGSTTGGAKVGFTNKSLENLAKEIADDELDHVRFIRKALGSAAIAKPAINLDALGIGFKTENEFIILARAFEDVGVSAYRGAAKLIENNDYLDAAAGILATEAYHAGHLRSHAIYAEVTCPKLDGKDQPPMEKDWVPTDGNGIAIGRTPAEVLSIVRGKSADGGAFFPNGLNGNVK